MSVLRMYNQKNSLSQPHFMPLEREFFVESYLLTELPRQHTELFKA